MFRSQGLRHLVVVNNKLQVVGMLTRKDFQKAGHDHGHASEHHPEEASLIEGDLRAKLMHSVVDDAFLEE